MYLFEQNNSNVFTPFQQVVVNIGQVFFLIFVDIRNFLHVILF